MTKTWFRADPARGLIAIYEADAINPVIEDNPIDHLGVTKFNSKLEYVGTTVVRKTYTIPACPGSAFNMVRVPLGAHGKGFTPMVKAKLVGFPNGDGTPTDVELHGGVVIDFYGERPGDSGVLAYAPTISSHADRWSRFGPTFARRTSLNNAWSQKSLLIGAGANDTELFLWYEQAANDGDANAGYPAIPLTIDFYVGDRSIDADDSDAFDPQVMLDSSGGEIVMRSSMLSASGPQAAGFSSRNLHLVRNDANPLFEVATQEITVLDSATDAGNNSYARFTADYGSDWAYDVTYYVWGQPTVPPAPVTPNIGLNV